MELNVSGLVSGFDWKSMVDQLAAVERAPQRRMRVEQNTIQRKNAAYTSLKSELTLLKDKSETLKDADLYESRSVSSTQSHLSATAEAGTAAGDYKFEIFQLATTAKQLGGTDVGASVSTTAALSAAGFSIPVTAGTVTVQGKQVTVDTDDSLTTTLDAIKTAVGGSFDYSITGDKVTLTDSSAVVLGSAVDTSNFIQALRLTANGTTSVTSGEKMGGIDLSKTMDAANLTDGAGTASGEFSINGTSITYASTDTITDILDNINNSEAGVNANYDAVNDRFLLTNKAEGDLGITLSDTTGDFLAKTRLLTANSGALSRGNNLLYNVNGTGPLSSTGNTIDQNSSGIQGLAVTATSAYGATRISSVDINTDIITTANSHGYKSGDTVTLYSPGTVPGGLATGTTYFVGAPSGTTFTLHTSLKDVNEAASPVDLTSAQTGDVYFMSTNPSTATITVQSDTTKIKTEIASLVTTLNKVQSMIAAQTASSTDADGKVTLGVMAGESLVSEIARELRSKAVEDVTGITGTIKRLESIGYTTSGYTNQITLSDETSLDTALRDNIGQVEALFTTTTYGIGNSIFDYLDIQLDDDGSLATTQENMTDQVSDIDKQIADHERRVEANRQVLIRSFVAMETAQAKINQQMSFLSQRFGIK